MKDIKYYMEHEDLTANQAKLNVLFDELVPPYGDPETVAGEIVRAINRIGYCFFNAGEHLGVGSGKEMCNPAGRYLAAKCDDKVAWLVNFMSGIEYRVTYEALLDVLAGAVLEYLEAHPELKAMPSTETMWDYRNWREDRYVHEEEDDYDDY